MSVLSAEAVRKAHEMLPPHCVDGVIAYFDERRPVGDFLTSVLANDLMMAVLCADHHNQPRIADYVKWLAWYAPARATGAWGSREAIAAWLNGEVQL